ncbi:histone chaperone Rttp106-like-domain-containing protein [Crassisporium funariophilum]|nr:histone chaperone Rttp106-like-domain-containing protein [Crassisporium funariophilum]
MTSESHYLRAIMPSLPKEIASKIRNLCTSSANEPILENFVRFLCGADYSADASKDIYEQWSEKQATTRTILSNLRGPALDKKRARDENTDSDSQQSKRQRLSPVVADTNGNSTATDVGIPLYTLRSISVTSPVRKKADITIHKNAIKFTHPTTHAVEGTVALSSIRRAFIVPTRGKSKPHWTVILLSSDTPDRGKPKPGTTQENPQVIFGIDATSTTAFTVTSYNDLGEPHDEISPKGSETLFALQAFVSYLGIPVIEPTAEVFKSACPGIGKNAGVGGIPGVEAYRAAKPGNLWFSKEGILWGESKPCEFWPVGDLRGKTEGVRIVGGGRTCSLTLTRRDTGEEDIQDDEEDIGEETEFGMIDGKEREGINEWVRNHRHMFGKKKASEEPVPKARSNGPVTIRMLQEDSDSDDEDFSVSVSDLDGSERLSDDSSSSDEGGGNEEGGGDEEGSEGSGKEEDSDGGEGDVEEQEDDGDEEEEEKELDPAYHPLLRPGAMPRMSKAAMEMAVDMVEDAFVGREGRGDSQDEEEDDLED